MHGKIALVTILTDDVPKLTEFYCDVLGFSVKTDLGGYVEFESEGVRFSICERATMAKATGHSSYEETPQGHAFELAFPVDSPEAVDRVYEEIVDKGATPIQGPADMPWNQRTAFFADPDGNVHELFADRL